MITDWKDDVIDRRHGGAKCAQLCDAMQGCALGRTTGSRHVGAFRSGTVCGDGAGPTAVDRLANQSSRKRIRHRDDGRLKPTAVVVDVRPPG
jgi:hypothetical protein